MTGSGHTPRKMMFALMTLLGVGDVAAQTSGLEEIVVTAQRREQSLQDVPISVSALSEATLRANQVTTLSDMAQIVPGLSITSTQAVVTQIALRGITSNDFGFATEQSIPLYLDGVYLGLGSPLMTDLGDVARVEVLKGPQGTLFGRNASGGAVSITTAPVSEERELELTVGAGNFGLGTLSGVVNVPLIDDTLAARAFVSVRQRDGWQENTVTGKDDGYEQEHYLGRVKFAWTPTETFKAEFTADAMNEDDSTGYSHLLASPFFPLSVFSNETLDPDGKNAANGNLGFDSGLPEEPELDFNLDRRIRGYSARLTWDIAESVSLESITSFRKVESAIDEDNDGTEYLMLNVRSFIDNEEWNQELRMNGQTGPVDWVLGANWYSQESDGRVEDSLGSYIVGAPIREANVVGSEVSSYGLFGDVIWSLSDRLRLSLGARYSSDEKEQHIRTPNQNSLGAGFNFVFPSIEQLSDENGNPAPELADLEGDWSDVSMRGVIDFDLTEDSILYLSLSEGYKSGGFNSFPIVDFGDFFPLATPGQLLPYDEESVLSYELGIKSLWLDGRLRLNASVFRYEWEDLQVQISRDKALFTINAGKAQGTGADLELQFRATEGLTLDATLGILNAEYQEDVADSYIVEGAELTYSPGVSATFGATYTVSLGGNGDLSAALTTSYKASHFVSTAVQTDSYSLLNGRVAWTSADEQWQVALWGRNLADETYIDQVSDFSSLGYISVRRNEPRTIGLEVSVAY